MIMSTEPCEHHHISPKSIPQNLQLPNYEIMLLPTQIQRIRRPLQRHSANSPINMSDTVVYSAVKLRNMGHKVEETQSDVIYSEVRFCNSHPMQAASNCEPTENLSTEKTGPCAARCRLVAVMCLAGLCAVLLTVIIVLSVSSTRANKNFSVMEGDLKQLKANYGLLVEQKNQLHEDYRGLQKNLDSVNETKNILQKNYSLLKMENKELKENYSIIKVKADVCALCPRGWVRFNFKCYYISERKLNWHGSKQVCSGYGAQLVIIDSEEEKDFINQHVTEDYWIGLYFEQMKRTWNWVDDLKTKWNRPETHHRVSDLPESQGTMSDRVVYSAVKVKNSGHKVNEISSDIVYSEVRICDSLPTQPAPRWEPAGQPRVTRLLSRLKTGPCAAHCRLVAVMCLAGLCAVLLTVIIVLSVSSTRANKNISVMEGDLKQLKANYGLLAEQKNQLHEDYRGLQKNLDSVNETKNILQKNYSLLKMENKELKENYSIIKVKVDVCGPCPWGWKVFASKCYYISEEKQNWYDGNTYCSKYGAHLVIIKSRQELKFLIGNIDVYWIGLTYKEKERSWMWVDDTTVNKELWQSRTGRTVSERLGVTTHALAWGQRSTLWARPPG
ncbi:hypothetical protein GN956_G7920 [Arapaima gigas]